MPHHMEESLLDVFGVEAERSPGAIGEPVLEGEADGAERDVLPGHLGFLEQRHFQAFHAGLEIEVQQPRAVEDVHLVHVGDRDHAEGILQRDARAGFLQRLAHRGFTGRLAFAYADGDEILPDDSRTPLGSIDPFSLVAGLGYRDPEGRFGGELTATHNARKSLESTAGVCTAECFRPDSFTVVDATVFVRPLDMLTLRAGVFNLTDEKYAYWSDIRGLAATSPVTDAYTRPGRNASVSASLRF